MQARAEPTAAAEPELERGILEGDCPKLYHCLAYLQVVMLFEADFWGGADMFGRLAPSTVERGKFFLFYSYTGISGNPKVGQQHNL